MSEPVADGDVADPATLDGVRKGRKWLFWGGIAHIVIGVLAVFFPIVFSLAANYVIGLVFVLAGGAALAGAFSLRGSGPFFGALLLALFTMGAGLVLLFNPAAGLIALTLVIAVIFLLEGASHLSLAFQMRPAEGWLWMLFSGGVSIAAGLIIAAGLPSASLVVLGLLVGVNFISTGIGMVMVAETIRKAGEKVREVGEKLQEAL